MPLPNGDTLKQRLRIETDAELDQLDAFVAEAIADVETYLGVPIVAQARTFEVKPSDWTNRNIYLPLYPIAASPAPVAVADDGVTVDAGDYLVSGARGRLRTITGKAFSRAPYQITATVGLTAAVDYASRIEPGLIGVILDLAAVKYARRNPALTSTMTAGTSEVYTPAAMPPDIARRLDPFRSVTRAL